MVWVKHVSHVTLLLIKWAYMLELQHSLVFKQVAQGNSFDGFLVHNNSPHVGDVGTSWHLLTGHNVLLLRQIPRDLLRASLNRHDNTWYSLWWTSRQHRLDPSVINILIPLALLLSNVGTSRCVLPPFPDFVQMWNLLPILFLANLQRAVRLLVKKFYFKFQDFRCHRHSIFQGIIILL